MDIFRLTFLDDREFDLTSDLLGDAFNHLSCLLVLPFVLLKDQTRDLDTEVDDSVSLGFSLKRRIDTVSSGVVSDSLLVSLQVLKNSGSVAEQVGVTYLHPLL